MLLYQNTNLFLAQVIAN